MARRPVEDKGTVVSRSVTHHPDGSATFKKEVRTVIPDPPSRAFQRGDAIQHAGNPGYTTLPAAEYAKDLSGVQHQQGSPSKVIESGEIDVLNGRDGTSNSGPLPNSRYDRMVKEIKRDIIEIPHDSI